MNTTGSVIKKFEGKIAYAHRAENFIENGKPCLCWFVHGHNADLIVEVSGQKNEQTGMTVVFSDIKDVVTKHIINKWDHAFLYNKADICSKNIIDAMVLAYIQTFGIQPKEGEIRAIGFDTTTSVENLTQYIWDVLEKEFATKNVLLEKVTLMETPTSGYTITRK
jgi:6-pyruvoyltetrahydropterin/6-carboxytetrahydropterin synthase